VTVIATAMIYASLKTVPRWHTILTPICYLLFAAAGGGLLATMINAMFGAFDQNLATGALILLVLAWAAKSAWWARAGRTGLADAGSSPETATGLGSIGKVRLLEAPHTSENYLMKEMVHRIGRKHAQTLRIIALILGGALPVVLLLSAIVASGSWLLLAVATVSHFAGMLAERWLFFAEAEHSVSLYYGHR
jgi:DMSO reductase anchor subunit